MVEGQAHPAHLPLLQRNKDKNYRSTVQHLYRRYNLGLK